MRFKTHGNKREDRIWKNCLLTKCVVPSLLILLLSILIFTTTAATNTDSVKISIQMGEDYRVGETITLYASLTNKTGEAVNASTYINVTIRHWNGTALEIDLSNVAMNWTGQNGWYYYNWIIPEDADSGSYGVLVTADPNGVETHSTSGFHVAPWAQEIRHIWQKFQRVNTSVIHNETLVSEILNSTENITIKYNITVPLKEGFTILDYLPVRWKFWFIDENGNCVNQQRKQRFIEPYCNPLIAQVVGLGNSSILVNVTIRPSLGIGNYTIVRELEVDPQQIWISYGKGPVGKIIVLEDNLIPLINARIIKQQMVRTELGITTTTTTSPISTTTLEIEKQKAKVIEIRTIRTKEHKKRNFLEQLSYSILVLFIIVIFYFTYTYAKKKEKAKEKNREKWYEKT